MAHKFRIHLIVVSLLILPLLLPGSNPNNGQEDEKALQLLKTARTRRVVAKYRDALNMLTEAASLTDDRETLADIHMETAYVQYLMGSSLNIYKRNIHKAYDLNRQVTIPGVYEEGFKRTAWEVREEKTGVKPPPILQEPPVPTGRMGPGWASPEMMEEPTEQMKKNRLDLQYIYEYLTPHDIHGAWESYYFKYYRHQTPTFNFFVHGGAVKRNSGKYDYIGLLGFAKDWKPRFFTYTVVAKGSIADYMPNARIDQDFNYKVGIRMNPLLTLGVTYIKYYVPAEDFIISGGFTWYTGKWIFGGRLFWNHKYPGDIQSLSYLLSVAYGRNKKSYTTLTVSGGSQAYLALYVLLEEEVRQSAFNINLNHRQWLTRGIGFFLTAGYLDLDPVYRKVLLSAGVFFEF